MSAFAKIPVGVIVERLKAQSHWIDHVWRPANVLEGIPEIPAWTLLEGNEERALFYAGSAEVELYISSSGNYREKFATGFPKLWIILRPTGVEPPFEVALVTADPFEGEGLTEGAIDLIETVPMPENIQAALRDFIAEHHVDEPFVKRKRDKANLESLARRPGGRLEKKVMSGEDEGFLGRWARRKQEVQEEEKKQQEVAALPTEQQKISAPNAEVKDEEPQFDVSTLPSIDSIVAGTDIRAFLSKGVPAALTQAALRKAWSADPAIRDYIGLSENSWDFNALDGQHGFAPLSPSTDIKQMLAEIFGEVRESAEKLEKIADAATQDAPVNLAESSVRISDLKAAPSEATDQSEAVEAAEEENTVGDKTAHSEIAAQKTEQPEGLENEPVEPLARRHGSALPT